MKYFDLQVNGYAGVDFNSNYLTEEKMLDACRKLAADNVEGIIVTIITDEFNRMLSKIRNLASLLESIKEISKMVKGIHIEGPFLNQTEGYRGAHPKKYIIPSNIEKLKNIIEAGKGFIRLFTLSPEVDNDYTLTKYLSNNGVVVSAGHSNASLIELNEAISNGLKMFTHLGNGSPNNMPRHDNIINRVLSLSDQLHICFIADDIHIPSFALKNYLKIVNPEKCIVTTDCMAAASAPPGTYTISHIKVEVGENRIVKEFGKDNLAGSAFTMEQSEIILKDKIGLDEDQMKKYLKTNAKRLLNI